MKHVKNFNDSDNNLNESNNEKYNDIEPLTIEEFTNIREAMFSVRTSNSPSAFQAKPFFNNEENFKTVMSKLEKLLLYGIIRYRLKKYNKNRFNILLILFLFISCTPVLKTTDQIENMLNDIYKQKVLLCVYKSKNGTVIFESPIGNKQYLCTSSIESKRWNVGDTLIIKYKGKLLSDEDEKTILNFKPHRKKK